MPLASRLQPAKEVRPRIELGLRSYHERVLPLHLQTFGDQ